MLGAVVTCGALLAACSLGGDGSTSSDSDGQPVKGGVLTFARSLDADTGLDPITGNSNGSIFIETQIFDQLLEIGNGPKPHPGLAESWDRSKDGLTWTFHLREAKFSTGDRVTADDVVFSLDRFADPKIDVANAPLGESIKSIQAVDPKTVRIELKHVDAPFLDNISMFAASIVSKKAFEAEGAKAFSKDPVGSGPFMVKEYVRGQRTVLARNPYYWREGQPYLDGIDFEYIPEANSRVLELRSGEADVADAIPYNQVSSLDSTSGLSVQVRKAVSWDSIFLNSTIKPLDEPKVRQALNYATPKQEILDAVLYGNAEIANSNIPPLQYWDESVKPYPYDLEKAKELLSQSSVPNGFDLQLYIAAGDPVEKQTAEIIQSDWAKIGVNVNIVVQDLASLFSDWLGGKAGMAVTLPGNALSSNTPSDDEMSNVVLSPAAGVNSLGTYYDNPTVNRLIADARGTLNQKRRAEDFAKIQRIALADAPSVTLFFTKSVTGVSDNVHDFLTYPIGWWPMYRVWLS